jgi:hypothetical protein
MESMLLWQGLCKSTNNGTYAFVERALLQLYPNCEWSLCFCGKGTVTVVFLMDHIQHCFMNDCFFFFSCRMKDAQGRRQNTPDRIRIRKRRHHARTLQYHATLEELEDDAV